GLTVSQVSKGIIIVNGTLTSNAQIVWPAGVDGSWIVTNNNAGAFTLTGVVNGGSNNVSLPQAGANAPTIVYSDGTNLMNANVSTAGLAPIASPAFTGTPTAPTAAS